MGGGVGKGWGICEFHYENLFTVCWLHILSQAWGFRLQLAARFYVHKNPVSDSSDFNMEPGDKMYSSKETGSA